MKIIDILSDSATLLGLTEETQILKSTTTETESKVLQENLKIESLFNLLKLSIKELCTNYVPMLENVIVKTEDKKYPLNAIKNFIRIQNVFKNENQIKFKVVNRNLIFDEDGEYVVSFLSYPEILSMFEEIDYLQSFNPDVIVFGLCSYFSLAHGMFDEFERFHEKYISKAESLKILHSFELPGRRWE